ncbi:MAG: hypothetical protein RJB38_718 [Pseudomonadota bacterium]|jgi:undecaprenyl-diphosphatase
MTLIESIALAIIHGFCRFIPASAPAHEALLHRFLGFPLADAPWKATFSLACLMALLLYFIHDWLSIFSSFLQVLIFRRKPMTFDERFPFFLLLSALLPVAMGWYLAHPAGAENWQRIQSLSLQFLAVPILVGSLVLWASERWSRKSRGLFDLSALDSVLFGLAHLTAWIPGLDGGVLALTSSQLRNYHWEGATKILCLLALPFLMSEALPAFSLIGWGTPEPIPSVSWFQWVLALLVGAGSAFIGLRMLNEQIRQNGPRQLIVYRVLVGAVLVVLSLWRG